MKIGIGITTTPNRSALGYSFTRWAMYLPNDAFIFVYEDKEYRGVAYSKNKCLKQLEEQGATHFFLADDDCYPLSEDWYKPYVESSEPHLMYQFRLPNKPKTDMQELYRDDNVVAYSHTRGAMLYVTREVLEKVGGMDTEYGQAMYEHTDWTNRIHNAGLTTYRAMDVPGSDKLLYCLDQDSLVETSISPEVRRKANHALYKQSKTSKEYKEFR